MSNKAKVYVAGVGMITGVGGTAESSAVAVRAGVSKIQESDIINKYNDPMKLALVPDDALAELNEQLLEKLNLTGRQKRMLQIADPAMKESFANYKLTAPVPLFLSVPETVPGCPSPVDDTFLDNIITQSELNIDRKNSRLFYSGRPGSIQAIALAIKYFESTGNDFVLVGGVDSPLDYCFLGKLDIEDRIMSEEVTDAFVPGEAAGFLLLASERVAKKNSQQNMPEIYKPGLSIENGHRYSDLPYLGNGLSNAFRDAINNGTGQPVNNLYASINGENFGTKELGVALMRNNKYFDGSLTHHPAENFGDIGAAFGSVLLGLAIHNNKPDTYHLIYASSEGQSRAAVYLKT